MAEKSPLVYRYHFSLQDASKVVFEVNLDPETLEYIPSQTREMPEWTRFDYSACEQCVLQQQGLDHCPVAANIAEVVEAFKDIYSYDIAHVLVEAEERVYFKEQVSIQQAISSLLGIIMVTSGCEDLDKLRPMVRFHLPFATIPETIYRAASMYLLAQFIRKTRGMEPDWDLKELTNTYARIDHINANLCKRLQIATDKDASLNAVVILDTFAQMVPFSIEETLVDFEHIFARYLS